MVRWLGALKCIDNYLRIEQSLLHKYEADSTDLRTPADRERAADLLEGAQAVQCTLRLLPLWG